MSVKKNYTNKLALGVVETTLKLLEEKQVLSLLHVSNNEAAKIHVMLDKDQQRTLVATTDTSIYTVALEELADFTKFKDVLSKIRKLEAESDLASKLAGYSVPAEGKYKMQGYEVQLKVKKDLKRLPTVKTGTCLRWLYDRNKEGTYSVRAVFHKP